MAGRCGAVRYYRPGIAESLSEPLKRRARHAVRENARVPEAGADAQRFALLMNASHASLRDDHEVSVDALDRLVSFASERRCSLWRAADRCLCRADQVRHGG